MINKKVLAMYYFYFRLQDEDQLMDNQRNLMELAKSFLDSIITSLPGIPLQLRTVCHCLFIVSVFVSNCVSVCTCVSVCVCALCMCVVCVVCACVYVVVCECIFLSVCLSICTIIMCVYVCTCLSVCTKT